MPFSETDFFRQATLRLCSSLAIEKGMSSCLQYISGFMPAYKMYLELYEDEFSSLRTIAIATESEGVSCDILTHMSHPLGKKPDEMVQAGDLPLLGIVNQPEKDPDSLLILNRFNEPKEVSIMWMVLAAEEKAVGALTLLAKGENQFTEDHTKLFSLLKEPFTMAMSNTLKHRQVLKLKDLLADDNRYLQQEIGRISGEEIIGADFGLKGVMEMVGQVALLGSPVIIFGETGTGKEVIARAIHNLSKRRLGPFIKVNCGAIPESLMDSELFGHEKGAYTGAIAQKRGRFERAHTGTIFLDEIGELSQDAQVRLLRVLQEKEIERVGGAQPIKVDIRVIAATHRDLKAMIKQGAFREDLFYRLQVFPISIPPLRRRIGDIPSLVQHFISQKAREMGLGHIPGLEIGAMENLTSYSWPGNVRELENAVERSLILCRGEHLNFPDLRAENKSAGKNAFGRFKSESLNLDLIIKKHIQKVLVMTKGKVEGKKGAAELLGLNPSTLRHRMRKLNIPFGRKAL